jgi:hypothetical protein
VGGSMFRLSRFSLVAIALTVAGLAAAAAILLS